MKLAYSLFLSSKVPRVCVAKKTPARMPIARMTPGMPPRPCLANLSLVGDSV